MGGNMLTANESNFFNDRSRMDIYIESSITIMCLFFLQNILNEKSVSLQRKV